MKRTMLVVALTLAACEGEPPKVPQNSSIAPAGAGISANDTAAEIQTPESVVPAGPGHAAAPCNCACGCGAPGDAGAALVAANDGGDAGAAGVAAVPAAAPVGNGNVVGHVTTTPAGAAANAVVYFEDGPVDPPSKRTPLIDNHMMNFLPFVQVVQSGGKVIFQNSDPFPHNVFSPDGKGFNVGIIAQHAAAGRVFQTPGSYSLLCNLHPGMLGYLVVTPNGHFAKANSTGHFAIKDVPPGTYKVTAWAPRQKPVTQSATVVGGGDVNLDFELHR